MEGLPTPINTIESKEKLKILYTGYFVKDVRQLIQTFTPKHPKVFGHHSTIAFKPDSLDGIDVGSETTLEIIGRVSDEKGDALLVKNVKSSNVHPHITLSCAEKVPPFYSGEMIEKSVRAGLVDKFDHPIIIAVIEGYFDGKRDLIQKE